MPIFNPHIFLQQLRNDLTRAQIGSNTHVFRATNRHELDQKRKNTLKCRICEHTYPNNANSWIRNLSKSMRTFKYYLAEHAQFNMDKHKIFSINNQLDDIKIIKNLLNNLPYKTVKSVIKNQIYNHNGEYNTYACTKCFNNMIHDIHIKHMISNLTKLNELSSTKVVKSLKIIACEKLSENDILTFVSNYQIDARKLFEF